MRLRFSGEAIPKRCEFRGGGNSGGNSIPRRRSEEAVPRSESGVSRSERQTEDAIPRTAEVDVLNERSEAQR
jgi:hypothetical protein